jgi:hypothetical protein
VIRDLGLEHQIIFNKGSIMVVPSGVSKKTDRWPRSIRLACQRKRRRHRRRRKRPLFSKSGTRGRRLHRRSGQHNPAGRNLVALASHMHEHATRMTVWKVSGGQSTLVYQSFDWADPPARANPWSCRPMAQGCWLPAHPARGNRR